MEIPVNEKLIAHLNAQAAGELARALTSYANDLLQEAGRLEASQRSSSGSPEITSSMLTDANVLLRRGYRRRRRGWDSFAADVLSYFSTLFAGVSLTSLTSDWGPYVFVGSFVVAVLGFTYNFMKEHSG
jgi:hypothetical protein